MPEIYDDPKDQPRVEEAFEPSGEDSAVQQFQDAGGFTPDPVPRITTFTRESMGFLPDAVGHIVTRSPVEDKEAGWIGELFGDAVPYIQQLTAFAGVPGQLAAARVNAQNIADPDARRYALKILDQIQKLPLEEQFDLLTYLRVRHPEVSAGLGRPGLPGYDVPDDVIEARSQAQQLANVVGEATGVQLGVEGGRVEGETDDPYVGQRYVVDALQELFPTLDIKDRGLTWTEEVEQSFFKDFLLPVGDWGLKYETIQQTAALLDETYQRAQRGEANLGTIGRDSLRLVGLFAAASGDIGFDIGGDITRRIPVVGQVTADFAGRQARAAEEQIGKAIEPVLTYGFEPIGKDPNTGEPIFSLEDQRAIEARSGAFILLTGLAGQATGSVVGRVGRRVKVARSAAGRAAAEAALETRRSIRRTGPIGAAAEVYRRPVREVVKLFDKALASLAKDPEKFFSRGISGRQGRILLDTLDAARKHHSGTSQEAIDGQVGFVRQVYGDQVNEGLVREMLKAPNRDIAKRIFVDTLMNPEAGSKALARLRKERQSVQKRLGDLERKDVVDSRPERRAAASAKLEALKHRADIEETTPELTDQIRQALEEFRKVDGEDKEISRLRLADVDLDYRIKTTFDDSPMLRYPKQNILRAAVKGSPTTRLSRIINGAFVREGRQVDVHKFIDDLPKYPELHVQGTTGIPPNAVAQNANVLGNYLRRAGVSPRLIEQRLGELARTKNRTDFFELVERKIFGPGGDIDKALSPNIDPELRGRIINLHDTPVETRSYSWVVDTFDTPHGLRRAERPVLGVERLPGEFTPIPSRPSEFIKTLSLPDIDLVIQANSMVSRGMRRIERAGGVAGAGHMLVWRLPKFLLRMGTMIGKPLVMLPRVLLGAMPARIQLEQMLRNANFGYKPLKGLPDGVTLFPGGIPIPLTRGVRVGKAMFGENGWRLLDPDPRLKGFSGPENTDMGMFMSEMLDDAPVERVVETTYEFRSGRRTPKAEHWEAFRTELETAHGDFIDRRLAQLDLDEDAFLEWLRTDSQARRYLATEQMPELDKAYPPIDLKDQPAKRLSVDNSFVEMAGYTDEGFLYHVTRPEHLQDIQRTGLEPKAPPRGAWEDGGVDERVYLGREAATSSAMANIVGRGGGTKEMVLLRIAEDKVPPLVERVGFPDAEVATRRGIRPDQLEYLAEDGTWKPLRSEDSIRLWAKSRIEYLKRLTNEDPKYLETIATGKSRVISRLGRDVDATGRSIRAKHDELVEKLDIVGVSIKEKLANRAPHSEVVALQNERLLANRELARLRRENPDIIADTKAIEIVDKRRWREHVRDEWTAGKMELPDRLLVEKRVRGYQADMGVLGNMEHIGQGISNAMYRPFSILSYADKHGTRGSLFTQAFTRQELMYRRRGLEPETAKAMAYARAGEITRDLMYDLSARSSFQRSLQDFFWFAPATQEVLYTWAVKIPAEAYWPVGAASLAAKGAGLIDVLSATGIIRENSDGEKVIIIPGLASLIEKVTGKNVPEVVYGKLSGLNLVSSGGLIPGLSTHTSWALGEAALRWGGVFKEVSDVMQQYGPQQQGLPQPIVYFWEAMTGSPPPFEFLGPDRIKADWDRSFDFGVQYAFADLQAQGIEPPRPEDYGTKTDDGWEVSLEGQKQYEKANRQYINTLMEEAQRYAQGIAWVRAIGSSASPMSLYVTSNEREEWENFWNKVVAPQGFGDQGLSDRQRDLIDNYISRRPQSFAYTVFYRGQGEQVRELPFPEDVDDAVFDEYYTGEARTLEAGDFRKKLMWTEARRYYTAQLESELKEISPNNDPWEILTNGSERKDALAEYRKGRDRWLFLNPDAEAFLLEQQAHWMENNDVPKRLFETERLAETLHLLDEVAPMLTGEEGIRPDFLRDTRTQLAILYSEQGDFGAPNTKTEKALEWWFTNVFDEYIDKTVPIYDEIKYNTARGLEVSHLYDKIRDIQNQAPPKYKGQGVPSVEAMFFGNRNKEEQRATVIGWQSRPVSWLSDFQLEKAGYKVNPDAKKLIEEISQTDSKMWAYIRENDISYSSKEYDDLKAERERYLFRFAQGLGPEAVKLWALNEAAPYTRLNHFDYGYESLEWGKISSAVDTITARIRAQDLSPRGFGEYAESQKVFLYRAITSARLEDPILDEVFDRLSESFPHPKGGWREGATLYEAVFFGNFNIDFIPPAVAQAAAGA